MQKIASQTPSANHKNVKLSAPVRVFTYSPKRRSDKVIECRTRCQLKKAIEYSTRIDNDHNKYVVADTVAIRKLKWCNEYHVFTTASIIHDGMRDGDFYYGTPEVRPE